MEMKKEFDKLSEQLLGVVRYKMEEVQKDISWEKAHPSNKLYGNISQGHLEALRVEECYYKRRVPILVHGSADGEFITLRCPVCDGYLDIMSNYCSYCGQRVNINV